MDRPVDFPQSGGFDLCLFAGFHLSAASSGPVAGFKAETKEQTTCLLPFIMAALGMGTNVNVDGPPPVPLSVPVLVCV